DGRAGGSVTVVWGAQTCALTEIILWSPLRGTNTTRRPGRERVRSSTLDTLSPSVAWRCRRPSVPSASPDGTVTRPSLLSRAAPDRAGPGPGGASGGGDPQAVLCRCLAVRGDPPPAQSPPHGGPGQHATNAGRRCGRARSPAAG